MTALWTSKQAEAATNGATTGNWTARGVSIDSRTVAPDDLFVAIQGPNHDGGKFVEAAFAKGAAAAMVHDTPGAPGRASGPLLVVENTTAGLEALGRAARDRGHAKIVCVTGSMGKTGVKEALALVLGQQDRVCATQGNLNNQWGLPLSLSRMSADTDFGVFELGMNRPGEIDMLTHIARPDIAIITNIDAVHLEFFDSEAAIADAKAEIFKGMGADGVAILNRDNAYFEHLHKAASAAGISDIRSFGAHPDSTARLTDLVLEDDHSIVCADIDGATMRFTLGAPGRHWALNSLAVLAAVSALGADVVNASASLVGLHPLPGRGARTTIQIESGAITVIDESYNANPSSMRAALAVLGAAKTEGRRIAVMGDMLELGPDAAARHADLAEAVSANAIDLVFTVGPNMARLHDALPTTKTTAHADASEGVAKAVVETLSAGDVVMIKGSLGSRMSVVIDAIHAQSVKKG
ncbi:MAG: UDP-N-acetylmuramoyl-tripeptide--D-alanyl-D-alanine ligase [Alphaproteobacteria bacterium]